MKKVVNITIGGVVFSIEEDAYTVLSQYIETVRDHFSASDEGREIIDDIELGIAEKFNRKKTGDVIRLSDVEAVIADMGTVADFADADDAASGSAADEGGAAKRKKKLYRDVDDQIIGGVASGIAAYLGIDTVFVRLLFVLSIFLNGFGILLYLVLWIVMPAAETVSQKLEMQGDPVTLHQFEKLIKDKMPVREQEVTVFRRALRLPFVVIRGVLRGVRIFFAHIGPLARTVTGVVLVALGIAVELGVLIALTTLHFSINSGLFDLPVRTFLSTAEYVVGLAALCALGVIPATLIVLLGCVLLRKTSKHTGMAVVVLVIVWMGALFTAGHTLSRIVPAYQHYIATMEEVTDAHELPAFTDVVIYSADNVTIQQGDAYAITIAGKEASVARRTFGVHNGVLTVNNQRTGICIGCFDQRLDIVITTPTLTGVTAAHNAHIVADALETGALALDLRHGAELEIDLVAEAVTAQLAHGAELVMAGSVDELSISAYYSSTIDTTQLESERTFLDLRYYGDADLGATDVLNVTAWSSSDVYYVGDPELTHDISERQSSGRSFRGEKKRPKSLI